MTIALTAIRNCLDGAVPAVIATCAQDGTPNVAYLSQVHYVDKSHVALSFQFFNKTRANVLANPHATVQVVDPATGAQYHLYLQYLRTEQSGPLFENMKAKLAGIASHTGMGKVFRLLGADVYAVLSIRNIPGPTLPRPLPERDSLAAVRATTIRLAQATDLVTLLDTVVQCLATEFEIQHVKILLYDEPGDRLYTVASGGYATSGVGSEIRLGDGVIGVAARERSPIRISHFSQDYVYSQAARQGVSAVELESEIPLPGLAQARSQLAVPICLHARLLGVLYVESPQDCRFGYEEEDALAILADYLAWGISSVTEGAAETQNDGFSLPVKPPAASNPSILIRQFKKDSSIFINQDYLIKGVAGAIFWKLMREYVAKGRTEFNNRELRLDPELRLPELNENLEARLILLQRRLCECPHAISLEKTGRGRFRLCIRGTVRLQPVDGAGNTVSVPES